MTEEAKKNQLSGRREGRDQLGLMSRMEPIASLAID